MTQLDVEARRALVVFARRPELGRVKTRLAATLGDAAALAIYEELTAVVARGIAPLARRGGGCAVVVACTPDDGIAQVRQWLAPHWPDGSWRVEGQGDGSLGARMERAVGLRFAEGASRVVVIGTDCPDVDRTTVEGAFAALDRCDAVFGPASDGGYYLIGVRGPSPELFRDVPWSSPDTLRVSLERARTHAISYALLAELADIDTAEDWARYRAR